MEVQEEHMEVQEEAVYDLTAVFSFKATSFCTTIFSMRNPVG